MIGDLQTCLKSHFRLLSGVLILSFATTMVHAQQSSAQPDTDPMIKALVDSITARRSATWEIAQKIWLAAEPGYQETVSSGILADAAEAAGLKVTRGVAEIPTAFTARLFAVLMAPS